MVHQKILSQLKELGCLNPEEYIDVRTHNLKWYCKDCGKAYQRSLMHQKKGTGCCTNCAKKINSTTQKITVTQLLTLGCLNPEEYINTKTKNLLWVCNGCDTHFLASYASRKISKQLCYYCTIKETRRPHKHSADYISSLGCLNTEEYIDTNVDNLIWKCTNCNKRFNTSLYKYERSTKLCKKCTYQLIANKTKHTQTTISTFNVLNPEEYINIKTKNMKYLCDKCGNEYITNIDTLANKRNSKHFCETCSVSTSSHELEIVEFIKSIYSKEVEQNTRDIIPPLELDIYLPDLKLAIELNGVYWHSAQFKSPQYHRIKYNACRAQGIKLLQFWDIDWINNSELIKSMLSTQIVKRNKKVFARNCKILEVSLSDAIPFLNKNHIQGFGSAPTITLGLYINEELQAVMCFKKTTDTVYDLTRFCTLQGITVVGGASRLLKHFIVTHTHEEITSFSDNMYSDGGLYKTLGFSKVQEVPVDYKYLDNSTLNHKFGYRHSKLVNKLEAYNSTLSEYQNCLNHGIQRVYDSGKIKWSLKI
jgi:hypothetical protein